MPQRVLRSIHRVTRLRTTALAHLVLSSASLGLIGFSRMHPQLGYVWDIIATAGAFCLVLLIFLRSAVVRAWAVGIASVAMLSAAEEWVRLTDGSLAGWSISLLWIATLIGVVNLVVADQDVPLRDKLDPPEPNDDA